MKNRDLFLWIGLGLLLFVTTGTKVYTMTRGLRNNNPGNIRDAGIAWRGKVGSDDKGFVVFDNPLSGIRAMTKVLQNYQDRHGLRTVREIVSRYAPPVENKTLPYIEHVAKDLNVNPDEPINVREVMPELITVMIEHENGFNPYSRPTIERGIALA